MAKPWGSVFRQIEMHEVIELSGDSVGKGTLIKIRGRGLFYANDLIGRTAASAHLLSEQRSNSARGQTTARSWGCRGHRTDRPRSLPVLDRTASFKSRSDANPDSRSTCRRLPLLSKNRCRKFVPRSVEIGWAVGIERVRHSRSCPIHPPSSENRSSSVECGWAYA